MNNIIMRKVTVNASYTRLAGERTVGTFDISCAPDNATGVLFKGDDGTDVPWVAGEWHTFVVVDLSAIQIKGTPGDVVTVVGGTW